LSRPPIRRSFPVRLGELFLALLLVVPPLVLVAAAKDPFRLPKLLVSGWLALASLAGLAWGLWRVERVVFLGAAGRGILERPVVRALGPLLGVATLTLITTRHPIQVREGLLDLWIGALALVGWSLALPAERLRRRLDLLLVPALILAVVGIAQYLDLWEPLRFVGGEEGSRLGVTSLAGNPGDLGAWLVLPALLAQHTLVAGGAAAGRFRWRRWIAPPALIACLVGIGITQSLTAVAALGAGSLVLWLVLLPRRRALPALAGVGVLLVVLVLAVNPLRVRVADKLGDLRQGNLNSLLTGRLDGWRGAVWMLGERPLAGVGHGAYRPSFGEARLALVEEGVHFYAGQQTPVFANAHNEYLEVAAEWGLPGALALAWALWWLLRQVGGIRAPSLAGKPAREGAKGKQSRAPSRFFASLQGGSVRGERALAWGVLTALGIQALTWFPFRVALVAWPYLVFLAWVFARAAEGAEERI